MTTKKTTKKVGLTFIFKPPGAFETKDEPKSKTKDAALWNVENYCISRDIDVFEILKHDIGMLTKKDLVLALRKSRRELKEWGIKLSDYSYKLYRCACGGEIDCKALGAFDAHIMICKNCGERRSNYAFCHDWQEYWDKGEVHPR